MPQYDMYPKIGEVLYRVKTEGLRRSGQIGLLVELNKQHYTRKLLFEVRLKGIGGPSRHYTGYFRMKDLEVV